MVQDTPSKPATRYTELLGRLDAAFTFCRALGLTTESGRFGQYHRDLRNLIEWSGAGSLEQHATAALAASYRVAVSESHDLTDLLPYLTVSGPQELKPKLDIVLQGPVLPSEEEADSNVSRNIQFELTFAAMLWRAGFVPKLGEHPDVRLDQPRTFLFECKRIFSPMKVETRIKEAGKQLQLARKNHVASAQGIVVVSLSRFLSTIDQPLEIQNSEHGKAALGMWLEGAGQAAQRAYLEVFRRARAVAIFFYVASDFANIETGRFDRGSFFLAYEAPRPPFAPYGKALDELKEGLSKLARP